MNTYVAIVLLCTFAHQGDLCTEETAVYFATLPDLYGDEETCLLAGNDAAMLLSEQIKLDRAGWWRVRCPRDLPA